MKSNVFYEVLDTVTVEFKDRPQTVIDRMYTMGSSAGEAFAKEDSTVSIQTSRNGKVKMRKFYYGHGDFLEWGLVFLRGQISEGENGKAVLKADIVYSRVKYWIAAVLSLLLLPTLALLIWMRMLAVGVVMAILFSVLGVIVLYVFSIIQSMKKDRHADAQLLKDAIQARAKIIDSWEK